MKKIWPYITIFFAGAFAAMTMVFFTQKPQTVINAETYIAEQNQKIGKIKQKGKDNEQDVEVKQKGVLSFLRKKKDIEVSNN